MIIDRQTHYSKDRIERLRKKIDSFFPNKSKQELEKIYAMTIQPDIEADKNHRMTRHQIGRCWACGEEVHTQYREFKLIGGIFWCGRAECAAEIADDFYPEERDEYQKLLTEYYADDPDVNEETFPFGEYVVEKMIEYAEENYIGTQRLSKDRW